MFQRFLQLLTPRSGRVVRENGELFNEADYLAVKQDYDLVFETLFNGAAIATRYVPLTGTIDYYVGISVPAGKEVILFDRNLSLNNGTFLLEIGAGTFTGGTPLLLNPLNTEAAPLSISSNFSAGVTPDAAFVAAEQIVYDTGQGSTPGGISAQKVFKKFGPGSSGMLRITRLSGAGDVDLGLQWVLWENDAT